MEIFTAACRAKGYGGLKQIAQAVNAAPSMVKDWQQMGRVPAVFFTILANAPTRRDREKEIRALMTEAKQRVRAENKRRAQADDRRKTRWLSLRRPLARRAPSGENATDKTAETTSVWPCSGVPIGRPLAASQSHNPVPPLKVASQDALQALSLGKPPG